MSDVFFLKEAFVSSMLFPRETFECSMFFIRKPSTFQSYVLRKTFDVSLLLLGRHSISMLFLAIAKKKT